MPDQLNTSSLPIAQAVTLAIIREVTAPKPGNVHRGADFDDVTYLDFIQSAVVIGPIVAQASECGIGQTILSAVEATREAVGTNTNLGTLLLIVPLAAVPTHTTCSSGIASALQQLSLNDTRQVFEAIRLASAGGLGQVDTADVSQAPPPDLRLVDAMRMASERDLVARQYINDFANVFRIADWIAEGIHNGWSLDTAIVHTHLRQLATEADSLIVRKCGQETGERSRAMAARVLESGSPGDEAYHRALEGLDFWLRSDGHRRNPGTTADLIAAALFVLLREGRVKLNQ